MQTRSLVLGAALLTAAGGAQAVPFDIAGPAQNDIDAGDVSVLLNTAINGFITDLNVQLVVGSQNTIVYGTDWTVSLSHGATTVVLSTPPALAISNPVNLDWTFDDSAASPISANQANDGTFTPDNPLSAFNGLQLGGTWTLRFVDSVFADDGDQLLSWRIFGEYREPTNGGGSVPEPTTLALLGAGLAGLALRRRRDAA